MAVQSMQELKSGVSTMLDDGGIVTLLIDQPNEKLNVINTSLIEDLERAVAILPSECHGLILASGKKDQFVAGADLQLLLQATRPEDAGDLVRRLHRVLNRLAALPYPTVAAINGPALGGGLELALACDYRVCVESDGPILGLPEVTLGLIPAGGGTQRLPRLVGLSRALGLILEGRRYSPKRARKYGLVDEVVHPAVLREAALAWLGKGKRSAHPKWSRIDEAAERWAPLRTFVYSQAAKKVRNKSRNHYPAPIKALEAVRCGLEQGFGAGSAAEAVAFGELAVGGVAHNLIHLFFATESLKKEQRTLTAKAPAINRVGVVGAGFMGAGIAQAAAVGGYGVRVRDLSPEAVGRGLKTARDLTIGAARKGRFSRSQAHDIISRLSGATDYSGFHNVDVVVEAVFEDVSVKRGVIASLEEVLSPHAIIATNTSSLPISLLAAEAKYPERIAGMHFFSPVHKMPLLEIIRGGRTSNDTIAAALEVGRKMGKTMIVVRDGPGFYTTRVLAFMVREAGKVFEEGSAIKDIDGAMTAFGFPIGPLALSDEVGLDVGAHVSEVMANAFGGRFSFSPAMRQMVESGRLGRKSGAGFYDYSGKKKKPDSAVCAFRVTSPRTIPQDLIQRRLVLCFVNEAARCLEEGVISGSRDGDVGAVLGIGFPPFLGGPFRYADNLGNATVVDDLRQMEYAYGPNFAPAGILERMAAAGTRFYED